MKIARLAMTASIAVACGFGFAAAAAEPAHTHWGYEGAAGPADWGHLSPDFAACEGGKAQSPVDIARTIPAKLGPVAISYQGGAVEVVNNGHTIQANPKAASSIEVEGKRYDLLQFHFHHPSEHAVNGKRAPMELHLVHKNQESGDLVVLGVMIVPGAANPALDAIWTVMPDKEGTAKSPATVDPVQLLPAGRDYFRYEGSLTTPPCSEVVHWVTFKQPITASDAQISRFAALFKDNARPLQPLNRRFVLESEGK